MNNITIQKKPLKKYIVFLLGFILISVFLVNVLVIATTGMFTPKPASVTIVYDPTDTTLVSTATSIHNYLAAFTTVKMVPVYQVGSLLALIAKISNPLVYVFHGNRYGWQVGNNFVTNNVLIATIQKSPSPAHFFVACDSDTLASMITNKYVGNLFGITDAQIGVVLIEEQLLTYYSTHGLSQTQYTKLNTNLQTYIRNNGGNLFFRLLHPVQPLGIIGCPCYFTTYSSSYAGPSGFYVTSAPDTLDQSLLKTALSSAVSAINSLISDLNDFPGLKITINAEYNVVNAKVVYSYYTETSPGGEVYYITWYSIVNTVSFSYYKLFVQANYVSPSSEGTDNQTDSSGISIGLDISSGSPSLETGGNLQYTTQVSYTQSPTNSVCIYYTNQWINSNVDPGWSVNYYLQLTQSYDAKIKVGYDGQSVSITLATMDLGGRISLSIGSSGNVEVAGDIFAKITSSASIPFLVSFSAKLLIVGFGIQAQWSNGNFQSAIYSGVYFDASASVTGVGSVDLPIIFTHAWYNDLGTSTNTLISNLASIEFGG